MQLEKHDYTNTLSAEGHRRKVFVDDVHGKFNSLKKWVYPILIAIFIALPFVRFHGQRWFLLDLEHRRFYIFGLTGNAQDVYLFFFIVTGLAFTLFFVTALFGRIWCGWACPQTVFLDGLFRKIERRIEGPRTSQIKLANQPWTFQKVVKALLKHSIYLVVAVGLAVSFVTLFTTHENILDIGKSGISEHPIVFGWILIWTGIIYVNFSWFREQTCLIVCPYGRLQSILMDDDSVVIGYDKLRGEPRGKKSDTSRGDCIDCGRCVAVCPTGIDIRNGMQMECIGCANCIDACDEVMTKIGQNLGLIRYDSLNGLEQRSRKILRPRIYIYVVLLLIGMAVSGFAISQRMPFEANLLRAKGQPYLLENQKIINQFDIHLFNKTAGQVTYRISTKSNRGETFILPIDEVTLEGLKDRHIPLFVEIPNDRYQQDFTFELQVESDSNSMKTIRSEFLGPNKKQ